MHAEHNYYQPCRYCGRSLLLLYRMPLPSYIFYSVFGRCGLFLPTFHFFARLLHSLHSSHSLITTHTSHYVSIHFRPARRCRCPPREERLRSALSPTPTLSSLPAALSKSAPSPTTTRSFPPAEPLRSAPSPRLCPLAAQSRSALSRKLARPYQDIAKLINAF